MGGFSDYKEIERESTSLWHACNYHNTAEKTENQTACGLQIWLFDYKTLHFTYKSGFSFTKLYFLNTKTAFRITKWHLVLLLSDRHIFSDISFQIQGEHRFKDIPVFN